MTSEDASSFESLARHLFRQGSSSAAATIERRERRVFLSAIFAQSSSPAMMFSRMRGARETNQPIADCESRAFSNHCLANTLEPLRAVNGFVGKPAYQWVLASVGGGSVTTSSGLELATEPLRDARGDMLVIMPSYNVDRFVTHRVITALQGATRRFAHVVGLETGAWLLAAAELLNGRTATIHWDVVDDFAETFPDINVTRDSFVTDGRFTTCGGAARAFDWVTDMIGHRQGQAIRLQVEDLFQGSLRPTGDVPAGLRGMVALMRRNIETPITISDIAAQLGMTQKSLERRCKTQLGATPAKIYQRMRLTRVRELMERGKISVAEAAVRDFMLKLKGYDAAEAFIQRHSEILRRKERNMQN